MLAEANNLYEGCALFTRTTCDFQNLDPGPSDKDNRWRECAVSRDPDV